MWQGSNQITNLAIDFTSRCNLHCSYCYLYSKQNTPQKELPLEELISVVEKTLDIFRSVSFIELWGGEPTIDPERLLEFVKFARGRGIQTWIPSTNSTLLDKPEHYNAWRFCNSTPGMNSQFSLDGNKKYHDLYRSNSYDHVVNNLRICLERGVPVSLRTTYPNEIFLEAIKENMVSFPTLYKQFLENPRIEERLTNHTFAVMDYNGRKFLRIYQEIDTIYCRKDIIELSENYRSAFEYMDKYIDNFLDDEVIFLPPYLGDTFESLISKKEYKEPKSCGSMLSQVYLHSPTGDVYPCLSQDVKQYKDIARLMNVHTKEIDWGHVNTIRAFMFRRNRQCIRCFIQESCFGPCYHTIPEQNQSFNKYWNTYNITKCTFAHRIFDIVVRTSKKILKYIDEHPL
jgi:radical SAM protein with 4Fe4S-binding SPASM domain